jgi:hypothetical protein
MATALRDFRRTPGGHPSVTSRSETPTSDERPLWQIVAILYTAIAFLAVLLIAVCFLAAYLVTGSAY